MLTYDITNERLGIGNRSANGRGLFLAVLILGLSAGASAATFLADARCVDNVADPQQGIGEVSSPCGVFGFPNNRFSPAGTASEDSVAFASAGPSGLRVAALYDLNVAGARSGQGGGSTQTYAEWNFDDFVITGPGLIFVPGNLRLFVSGSMRGSASNDGQGSLTTNNSGGGDFFITVELNGAHAGVGEASSGFGNGTIQETSAGLLGGGPHGGEISTIISSDQLMLPVGQAFSVHVDISANAKGFVRILGMPADQFDSVTAIAGGFSSFQNTVSFPTSGPVFDLPPGYTVNSVSAGIVNNQFVPEPSTLALSVLSLSALLSRRRRWFPSTMAP